MCQSQMHLSRPLGWCPFGPPCICSRLNFIKNLSILSLIFCSNIIHLFLFISVIFRLVYWFTCPSHCCLSHWSTRTSHTICVPHLPFQITATPPIVCMSLLTNCPCMPHVLPHFPFQKSSWHYHEPFLCTCHSQAACMSHLLPFLEITVTQPCALSVYVMCLIHFQGHLALCPSLPGIYQIFPMPLWPTALIHCA